MMELDWIKRPSNAWYQLKNLNLEKVPDDEGVYVIWYEDNEDIEGILSKELIDNFGVKKCVYVGQGVIRDRLGYHRRNDEVQIYEIFGTLHVTWASVPAAYQDGVEKYLADKLDPSVGERRPDVLPIAVNLPI